MFRILYSLLALVFFYHISFAQSPILWSSTSGALCDGSSAQIVENVSWNSDGCTSASVSANGERITLFSDNTGSIWTRGDMKNSANRTTGDSGEYGYLTLEIVGNLEGLKESFTSVWLRFDLGDEGEQNFIMHVWPGAESCPILVPANTPFDVRTVSIGVDEPIDNEIGFEYTFTTVAGSLLHRITVPESDFNGSSYSYNLPTGAVSLYPGNGDTFPISLEENKPTAQRISLIKSEGDVLINGYLRIGIQRASATLEPHNVQLSFKNVDLCIAGAEVMIEDGASLVIGNSDINYQSRNSCIGTTALGEITIAAGTSQQLGDNGYGMQLFRENSVMTVDRNADLTFDGIIQPDYDNGRAYIDVMPGASVTVTRNALTGNVDQERILVRLYDDAVFDMSEARPDLQTLFEVEQLSSFSEALDATAFILSPNPTRDGFVSIKTQNNQALLSTIEVIDITGRIVQTQNAQLHGGQYMIQIPVAGIYNIRFTDINGRVGTKRVVSTQ